MSTAKLAAELLTWIDERATTHESGGKILGRAHRTGLSQRIGEIWRTGNDDTDATEGMRALADAMNWDADTQTFYRGAASHPDVAADAICPPIGGDCSSTAGFDKLRVALRLLANDAAPKAPEPDVETIIAAAADENTLRIMAVAQSDETTEERLRQISSIDKRFYGKKSRELASLLSVSEQMIRSTDWWKVDRREQ